MTFARSGSPGGLFVVSGSLVDIAPAEVESVAMAGLFLKVILQRAPVAKVAAAFAATDRRIFLGILRDAHGDRSAGFAVKFVI
jgi:hypothetical protein